MKFLPIIFIALCMQSAFSQVAAHGALCGSYPAPVLCSAQPGAHTWSGAQSYAGGTVDASGATMTKPFRSGSALPGGACSPGETFELTGTSPALYICNSSNAWMISSGSGGGAQSYHANLLVQTTTIPKLTYGFLNRFVSVAVFDASGNPAEADISSNSSNDNIIVHLAQFISGYSVTITGGPDASQAFSSATSISFPAAVAGVHAVICYDTSTGALVQTGPVTFTPSIFNNGTTVSPSYDVAITFAQAEAVTCGTIGTN